jgi:transposase
MENTGMYSLELNCFLQEKRIWQTLENALQIKRSMGVLRGKTDKADSKTIAVYAYRFADKLKPYVVPGSTLLRLRVLFGQRERLVDIHRQIQLAVKSLSCFEKQLVADIQKQNKALLENLPADKTWTKPSRGSWTGPRLQKSKLIQSVPGIGL